MVAAVSGLLLVVVLAVDASMNRTYALDVEGTDGWRTFATDAQVSYPRFDYGGSAVDVADNTSVTFRVRADNGFPWELSKTFTVTSYGVRVAEGVISAPARGEGVAEFSLNVSDLAGSPPYPKQDASNYENVYLELHVGNEIVGGTVNIREART